MRRFVVNKAVAYPQWRLSLVTARAIALALAAALVMAAVFAGDASASSTPNDQDAPKTLSTPDPTPTAAPSPEPTSEPTPTEAPTPEPTPEPSPTEVPTPEPTPEPTSTPEPTATPEPEVTATPASESTPEPELELPPYFPVATNRYDFDKDKDIGTQTLPEAAGGAGGFTYSLSPALPAGLSFDPASRALTGTPSEGGQHSMTYTATDVDGTQVGLSFQIAIRAKARQVKSTSAPEKPGTPAVTRTTFGKPSNPALDVTWTAPASGAPPTGYEAQYRKKAAEGEDPAQWTAYSGTLGATTTSLNLPDLEAGATYEVQVRAMNNGERGPWSDTGSGRANRAPTATSAAFNGGTFPVGSIADYRETGNGALGVMFADADSDGLTYIASAEHPALLGISFSGTAGSANFRVTLRNQGSSKVTYGARDRYGGQVTRTVTFGITAKTSRSIAENSAAGTAVGSPVTGTPYNGVALSYTLKGKAKDSGKFVINSSTGQISVAQGATLDYETDDAHRETETWNGQVIAKFYRGEVHYTVDGHAAVINVNIKVTDIEPGQPGTPTLTRTQYSEPTDPGLDVTWTAPTSGATPTGYAAQYRKKAAEGEDPAEWTAYSGTLGATATSLTLSDLEAGATYEVQVRVQSDEGPGAWSDTGTGQTNRPPTTTSALFNGGTFSVGSTADYNETGNGALGVMFTDADGDALTYAAAAQHPALLGVSLSGAAGAAQLQVTLLNQGSSNLTYTATDSYGGSVTRTATIAITAKESRSIAENSAGGTAIGDPVTGTSYNGVALSYTLQGKAKDSGKFVIDSSTGQISVKQGATLDYETDDSNRETETFNGQLIAKFYRGEVHYTVDGHAAVINVIIKVTDVEVGQPDAPTLTRTQYSEPTDPGLDVSWTAPAANGLTISGYQAQYRKKAADGEEAAEWTAYSGTLGATATSLTLADLEAGATYEAQVRAVTSEEGEGPWSDTGSGRANRPPTATSAAFNGGTFSVGSTADYNETGNGALGVMFADADGDALTYAAAAQHPALLGVSLSGAAGQAQLRVTLLNQGSSNLTYTATDPYGGSVTRTATIAITAKESRSIAENSAAGTAVGDPVTGTPYNGVALSYTLQGNAADSGKFVIDSASGQISVKQGATLDYETDDSHRETETWNGQVIAKFYRGEVHYTVDGHAAVINVTIKVTDVEAGQPDAPTVTRTRYSEPTNPGLDVTWTAPTANGLTITGYNVQYRKKAADGEEAAAWTAYSGTIGATATSVTLSDLEAGATYEAQVRAETSEEAEGPWSDTGTGRANRPPRSTEAPNLQPSYVLLWGGDDSVRTLNDKFADDDGDSLTYSASAQYPGVLRVGIEGDDSDKLRIHVLNPATSTVTYGVSDGYGGYASKTIDVSGSAEVLTGSELSRSVAENSAAGTAVGDPVTGTPYDDGDDQTDDALTYTLTGEAATSNAFTIDSATGQITVKQGATIDFEAKSSYTGRVNWTVQGQEAFADVTIQVTDIEAGKPGTPTATRTRFEEESNPALDVTWTLSDANGASIVGYEAQYRQQVADDETPNAWTDYTGPLSKKVLLRNSLVLTDLVAGATYEVQVRALTSKEGPSPWSDTGSGRANRPPRSTEAPNLQPSYVLLWGGDDSVRTLNDKFADDDGDTLTYSASAQYPGVLRVGIEGDDSDKLRIHVLNPATSTVTYGVSDGYGGYASKTIDVSGSAEVLTGSELSRSVAENSAAGTAVGDPVTGTPYDDGNDETNDALTYTLTGEAATSNAFTIDSATGQITVKQGATIDFEAKSSYTGRVNWTVQGQEAFADVTVNVTDLEAGKPDAPTVTRTRFDKPTHPGLDVAWTASDANGTTINGYEAQYRKKVANGQTPNGWTTYTYSDADENITSKLSASTLSFTLPNLLTGAIYEFQVRAVTSLEGPGPWSDTGSARANLAPNGRNLYLTSRTYAFNTTVTAYLDRYYYDSDGDTLTWFVSSQYPGLVGFDLTQSTSYLIMRFLNPGTSTLTYGAHDGYGGFITRTVQLTTGPRSATRSVAENSAAGTAVGDPVVGNSYSGQTETFSYTLTGEAATSGAFVIDSATGQISVKQGATIDFETKSSYAGSVGYTVNGQATVINLTINVTDVEAGKPDAPTVTRTRFETETNPALDVTWTAPADTGATIAWYRLQYRKKAAAGEEAAEWTLSDQVLETTSARLADLEAGATYEVQVRAGANHEGLGPWSDTGEGTANRPPHHASHQGTYYFYVNNNQPVGETWVSGNIGTFFADPDGDTLSWDVSSQYPGIGNLGEYLVKDGTQRWTFHFYNPGTLDLTYGVHDGYGGYTHRKFSWTGKQTETRSIAENSPAGTAVGDPVTGTPYDDGDDETNDALTYTLTGEAATSGAFVIDSATGQISVQEDANLDFETKSSYTGKVNWTVQGQAAAADLTINLTDVEAGKPDAPTVSRTEFSEPSNPALDVTWTVPDANGATISGYEAQFRKKVADGGTPGAWTAYTYTDTNEVVTSQLSAATLSITVPDLEAGATYEFQVRALTALEGEGPWSESGQGQANRPPTTTEAALEDREIVRAGQINEPIEHEYFLDPDGDALSFSASAEYLGVLTARISAIGVGPGTDIDTLTVEGINPGSSTVTYGAHDGYGGYVSRTITVTVTGAERRSVSDRAAAGTPVGDPVTGTPYDDGDDQTDDALTYTLTGEAATSGAFVIDSATGQISVAEGATVNYATKSSYTGQVTYTVQGQPAVIDLTIEVIPVHEVSIALPETFKDLQPLDVTFTFGTDVTGFDASDVTVENGTLGTLSGSGAVYTATVTPNGDGDVTVTVAAGAALAADSGLAPRTATSKVSTYLWIKLEGPSGTRKSWDSFEVVATFSQPPGEDFSFRPWNSTTPVPVSVDGNTATFTLTPEYYQYRWGTWPYRTRIWVNWRGVGAYFEVYSDADRPRVHRITGPTTTQSGPFGIFIQLTEDVVNFSAEDLDVVNGEVSALRQVSAWAYEADINPTRSGRLTVDIASGAFKDHAGWTNRAARQWSVNVDLSPPAPDQPSVTQSASAPTTSLDVSWTAPDTGTGLPITDYDVWYRKPGEANWTDHPFDSTATQTTIAGLTPETTYQVQVRAVNADSPSDWSPTAEGATAANNLPPQFAKLATPRSVAENAPAGTPVGDPVTATDVEGHFLTYSLRESSNLFDLSSATGQLSVAEGASLDYEAGASYTLVIEVSDGLDITWAGDSQTADAEVTVTITVTDVAEPPDQPDAPSVAPSADEQFTALQVTWTAPANDGRPAITDYDLRYRQAGAAEWTAHDFTGTGTATTLQDLERGTSYEVQVAASNDEGTSPWSDAGTGRTEDYNLLSEIYRPGDGGDVLTREIAENSPAGTAVGAPIAATDGNGDALTFALTGSSAFVIDAASGQIRVAEGAVLDYETRTSYSVTVTVSDGKDANHQPDAAIDDTVEVTIKVLDLALPAQPDAPAVAPSAAQPTVVLHVTWTTPANQGRPAITDYDLRYREVGATSWIEHAFDGTGIMTWISGLNPDTAYEVQVAAANVEGLGPWSDAGEGRTSPADDSGAPEIGNNPPSFGDPPGNRGTVRQVAENAPGRTLVGAPVTATDSDGDALIYALSGSSAFVIDAASGQIRVATGAVLDYETTTSYTVTVSVTDGKDAHGNPDASVDATVDVTINVLNQLPPAKPDAPSVAPSAADPTTALDVSWTAPANNDQPAVSDYDLRYRLVGATAWTLHDFAGVGTTTTLPGLEPDTAYEVQVAAANVEGIGPWSDAGTGRTDSLIDPNVPNGPDGPDGPDGPTGSNGPGGPTGPGNPGGNSGNPGANSGNPGSTDSPSGSTSGPSVTTAQSRAAVSGSEPTDAGFGVFSQELGTSVRTDAAVNGAVLSPLAGFEVWTPEKALVFSFLGPGLLGLLGMLSTLLKWKFQMSLWTALLAGLAAIFLFFWRRKQEKEENDPGEAVGSLRPAT